MEDQDILSLYWSRDDQAIARSMQRYGGYCRAVAMGILRDRQDSEECVNDALLAAWNSIPPQRPDHLRIYLGKLTRHRAISLLRRRMSEKRGGGQLPLVLEELSQVAADPRDTEEKVDQRLLAAAISGFLRTLSLQDRQLFIQRYWQLTPIKDLAKKQRQSQGAVTQRLFRIRMKLKEWLIKEEWL